MSRLKQRWRRMGRDVEDARLAALRCPGCGRRNVLSRNRKTGIASCVECGHRVSADLYTSKQG